MRDIYELIRQRESEVERFQKEIERARKEVEALRLAAKLLDDGTDSVTRPIAATTPAPIAREAQMYNAAPTTAAPASMSAPAAWTPTKQFP